jgi:hypothetical protein
MAKSVMTVLNEWHEKNPDVPVLTAPPIAKDEDEEETESEAE